MAFAPWRALPGRVLLWALNLFSAIALIFEGYNQGVMGSVNSSAGYIALVEIGADGVVTNTTKQGGIVAVYYFGAMFGCFIGGKIGDRFGRKKAVVFGSILALIGGALQAGSQKASMTICARTICGLGIGTINSVCFLFSNVKARAERLRLFRHGSQNLHRHTIEGLLSPSSLSPTTSVSSLHTGLATVFAITPETSDGVFR